MKLSDNLISQFVQVTNNNKKQSQGTNVYGTIVESDGEVMVQLDGAESPTPITGVVDAKKNDRVLVSLSNHSATVIGNFTKKPSAYATEVAQARADEAYNEAKYALVYADTLVAGFIKVGDLEAEVAKFGYVTAENLSAEIGKFGYITANDLSAEVAKLGVATIAELDAAVARIVQLESDKITVDQLDARYITATGLNAEIANLGYITANTVDATVANLGYVKSTEIESTYLKVDMANIATANIDKATITDLLVQGEILAKDINAAEGSFSHKLAAVNIYGDNIIAGTITADRLIIRDPDSETGLLFALNDGVVVQDNLTEDELKRLTLNGQVITAESITADKINVTDLFAQDITATGTIRGVNLIGAKGEIGGFVIGTNEIGGKYLGYNADGLWGTLGGIMGPDGSLVTWHPTVSESSVYLGTDGIGCGTKFKVNKFGQLVASSGNIGGFTIGEAYIANGTRSLFDEENEDRIYLGLDGIACGVDFRVTSFGEIFASAGNIGGFNIRNDYIAKNADHLITDSELEDRKNGIIIGEYGTRSIYLGEDGIGCGFNFRMYVDGTGTVGPLKLDSVSAILSARSDINNDEPKRFENRHYIYGGPESGEEGVLQAVRMSMMNAGSLRIKYFTANEWNDAGDDYYLNGLYEHYNATLDEESLDFWRVGKTTSQYAATWCKVGGNLTVDGTAGIVGNITTDGGITATGLIKGQRLRLDRTYTLSSTDSAGSVRNLIYLSSNDNVIVGGGNYPPNHIYLRPVSGGNICVEGWLSCEEGISTNNKASMNDTTIGGMLGDNGRLYLRGSDATPPGIFLYSSAQASGDSSGASIQYDSSNDYLNFSGARGVFSGNVESGGWIMAGTRFYCQNNYGIRGLKSGKTVPSLDDSNTLCYVLDNDRAVFGSAVNSAPTEIRSPGAIHLKSSGATADDANTVVRLGASDDYGYFRPGKDGMVYCGGKSYQWRQVYTKALYLSDPGTVTTTSTTSDTYPVLRVSASSNQVVKYQASSSTRRYKCNITEELTDESINPENLYNVPLYQYQYKPGHLTEGDQRIGMNLYGFIVEELVKYYPSAVDLNSQGQPEDWNTNFLLPAMLKLIQNQHNDIVVLQAITEQLNYQMTQLFDTVARQQKIIDSFMAA